MPALVSAIGQHGYYVLFGCVLAEAIGLPIPAALALLVGGAASAKGPLQPALTLLTGLAATLTGDTLMFLMGRYTGWWLLGLLCRVSLNPETCILRSADSFYRRGRVMLVLAKFVPGINTIAPPMAGSMNMRFTHFFPLDVAGAVLYVSVYFGTGFLFSDFLGLITKEYTAVGSVLSWVIVALFAGYLARRVWLWFRARNLRPVRRISVTDLARKREDVAIFDARSHGYYDRGAMRIAGSTRLDPNALTTEAAKLPTGKDIVLYCTCVREATAIRVARLLAQEHRLDACVIAGGFRAWKKAGLPLEPVPADEVVPLPSFS
jgi:membrane protein DedA with SNARE-associated domain/rhodanese-related sulfurtransferase